MDYSYNFQDNILPFTIDSTSSNILNWVNENRDRFEWAKDPNAYELTNVFLFAAKYAQEGQSINTDTITNLWNIRSKDFERCNISPTHFVYAICHDSYQAALSGKALVNDENSHHALRKIAGIGLYLKQQQRDTGQISYNNPQELLQLLQCSSTLKTFHPKLFDKYAFKDNINVLCKLQLEHQLPTEIFESITSARQQLFEQPSITKKASPNSEHIQELS